MPQTNVQNEKSIRLGSCILRVNGTNIGALQNAKLEVEVETSQLKADNAHLLPRKKYKSVRVSCDAWERVGILGKIMKKFDKNDIFNTILIFYNQRHDGVIENFLENFYKNMRNWVYFVRIFQCDGMIGVKNIIPARCYISKNF